MGGGGSCSYNDRGEFCKNIVLSGPTMQLGEINVLTMLFDIQFVQCVRVLMPI